MKIIFMGTPDFSVPALNALVEGGHRIELVVTQPDKPKGRGKALQMSPVKEQALALGLPVATPAKIRGNEAFIRQLEEIHADVIVVIAFGQILPGEVLRLPKYGCVNIHASLLPRYRGAAPIQWAVINGEKFSGVTTMQMDEGLDTGDMLDRTVVELDRDETGQSLFDKLSAAGGELILKTLEKLENNTSVATPQTGESNYVGTISKAMGDIDWTASAQAIERLIRGLNPWPSAYTWVNGKNLKLWKAAVDQYPADPRALPGQILRTDKDSFTVQCGDGTLTVLEVQMEGKKRMDTGAFLRGFSVTVGEKLGKGASGE